MRMVPKLSWLVVTTLAVVTLLPASAAAFCGFYVGGAGSEMFADATQVTLMREGTRTVLSMQNRYAGPLKEFAMVVPVPVVLEEENVKTLEDDVFERLDMLTSPRLVEYWEKDPCAPGYDYDMPSAGGADAGVDYFDEEEEEVTVEAQFKVGEYNIVVLSTGDSTALEDWLTSRSYNIPDDAAPYFEPYVQSGMYFFVAQVDPAEVTFEDDEAVLSPLRFHYDSDDFSLPVRLGMINSRGEQDLIVNILAQNQRYELANYPNVTIPTNLEVSESVLDNFSGFYRALFAQTVEENPGAAITEYAWGTANCDPCPGPVQWGLPAEDVATLGANVIPGDLAESRDWVVTRLHMRYGQDEVGEDLIFQSADPIVGGREIRNDDGELESGATSGNHNTFQGRYIVRHAWEEEVTCEDPEFGRWGGPNGTDNPTTNTAPGPNTSGEDVFSEEEFDLEEALNPTSSPSGDSEQPGGGNSQSGDDSGCAAAPTNRPPVGLLVVLLGAFVVMIRRSRK